MGAAKLPPKYQGSNFQRQTSFIISEIPKEEDFEPYVHDKSIDELHSQVRK
jgi:hypothetical protein